MIYKSVKCLRNLVQPRISYTQLNRHYSSILSKYSKSTLFDQSSTVFQKSFHPNSPLKLSSSNMSSTEPQEFSIPVPFGKIAGKVHNPPGRHCVLCLHGWQDNAGTFDALAPLLPQHLSLFCLDLQGHGLSDYRPRGTSSTIMDYVLTVERAVQHFGWEKVIILGHSMGAGIGMLYAGAKPEKVHSLVMLDLVKPISIGDDLLPSSASKSMRETLALEKKISVSSRPSYPYEECVQRAMKGSRNSVEEEGVKTLLKRGTTKMPDGTFTFNADPFIKTRNPVYLSVEQQMAFARNLKCRMLLLQAKQGETWESKEVLEAFVQAYREHCPSFQHSEVEGTHHSHLNTPQHCAPLIGEFLAETHLQDMLATDAVRADVAK